ncbi:MAG: hypothetical protein IKN59_06080 [Paludibacteraceae bacterium]|nr:hypothetical protein [Paludibacteraceae bacterium]
MIFAIRMSAAAYSITRTGYDWSAWVSFLPVASYIAPTAPSAGVGV